MAVTNLSLSVFSFIQAAIFRYEHTREMSFSHEFLSSAFASRATMNRPVVEKAILGTKTGDFDLFARPIP